ncbi:MAG: DUF3124 domain-containing protein [Thermodesulfobacteriota bacterium]
MAMKKQPVKMAACLMTALLIWMMWPEWLSAQEEVQMSAGQTVYVPAYSHIYIGSNEQPFLLTVTLSVRNIDPSSPITVDAVEYYDTKGTLLKKHITAPVTLGPMESVRYVVPEKDTSGGSGANFIVKWNAEKPVNSPIIESIMIGAKVQQGISFTSRGRPVLPPAQ